MNHCVTALVRQALAGNKSIHADSDIRVAGMVLKAIARNRVVLCAQPVFSTLDGRQVLYQECLVRMIGDDDSTIEYPSTFIPSLERLELIRFLDRYVVGMVIEILKSDSSLCLGVNISAQSAKTRWWESILLLLDGRPDIACRLVVEITESTQLSPLSGRKFVERLQRLGCRVAVDDFGDGFSIENGARIGSPDIIKIAGRMLQTVAGSPRLDEFKELVTRARAGAPCVVVEGIEDADALLTACSAGAHWAQGYHTGRPQRLSITEPATDTSVEQAMHHFERIADALVDQPVDGRTRGYVKLAFAAGLANAVCGKRSAIATCLRRCLTDVLRARASQMETSMPLLRCFAMLGRLNGQKSECSVSNQSIPVPDEETTK